MRVPRNKQSGGSGSGTGSARISDSGICPNRDGMAAVAHLESVDNAFRLLLLLSREGELGVTEAAHQLGIAPSTSHRLFATLKYRGFVTQTEQRSYREGPGLLALSGGPVRKLDLVSVARPAMEGLRTSWTKRVI